MGLISKSALFGKFKTTSKGTNNNKSQQIAQQPAENCITTILTHKLHAPSPKNSLSYGIKKPEEDYTVERVKKDYDVDLLDESQISSLKRRARSATPRRTLNIEPAGPLGPIPICAYCQEEIDGPVLTALAPNAEKAQKFHPYHFMCCYCQKALNLHGTFREHERRPYCHDCFYKLWNGLVYEPDINQRKIEKLI